MSYPQDVDNKMPLEFATPWRRLIPYAIGGLGVMMIVGGVAINYINSQRAESVETVVASDTQAEEFVKGVNSVKLVKIDVSGAVVQPGVIEIPVNSRVQDVLISAGGLDAKADRIYVSRNINLAQPIQDGMKIYIPFEGEQVNSGENGTESGSGYNINNASQSKLEELPGIGPVTAGKIIANRPYQNIEELVNKKVISQTVFEKIKKQVTIN